MGEENKQLTDESEMVGKTIATADIMDSKISNAKFLFITFTDGTYIRFKRDPYNEDGAVEVDADNYKIEDME